MSEDFSINRGQLNQWAESLLHITHHGSLIQRELKAGNADRATDLAERARLRAWKILNELFECGAERPDGYRETGTGPASDLPDAASSADRGSPPAEERDA